MYIYIHTVEILDSLSKIDNESLYHFFDAQVHSIWTIDSPDSGVIMDVYGSPKKQSILMRGNNES